ncbi:MAG: hypothetical protein WCI18_06680 [Pseudomonadota bacterium]
MYKFVFVFGSVVMGLMTTRSFADVVPTAKSCENLKAELGLQLVGSDYNGYRASVMSPCLFDRDIQLGMIYGLIDFPYLGDDQWESVLGHEVLFSVSLKHDLVAKEEHTSGLKVQFGFGAVRVESQKYKNKEFEKTKTNSIGESDLSLGWYTTYQNWETNLGLINRNFDNMNAYSIKNNLMPQRDFGYQIGLSYLIK